MLNNQSEGNSNKKKKVKVSTIWCEGCSGCHMSFLDMDERIIDLINRGMVLDASPITDLKVPSKDVDIGIIEGAVATDIQIKEVKMMREKCKKIVAIGDCAVFGGIPSMRNRFKVDQVLQRVYIEAETNYNQHIPQSEDICKLTDRVMAVNEVIDVDYYIPGCPPSSDTIYNVLINLLEGKEIELKGKNLSYE